MAIRFGSRSFDTRPQQRLVSKRGTCARWERVTRCTCSGDSNRPDTQCLACHGSGFVVLTSKVIKGLVTNAMSDRLLSLSGVVQLGDLVFSQYPQNKCDEIQPMDRIVLLDFQGEPFDGEYIVRGSGDRDDLQFPADTVYAVTSSDPATGVVTTYVQGTDFVIDIDDIVWIGSHRPAETEGYFIKYSIIAEYVAMPTTGQSNAILQRYEGVTNLGQRVILRRRQFVDETNPVPEDPSGLIVGPYDVHR